MSKFKILMRVLDEGKSFFVYKTIYALNKSHAEKASFKYAIKQYDYYKLISIREESLPFSFYFQTTLVLMFILLISVILLYAQIY